LGRRALVIANPAAGRTSSGDAAERCARRLSALGLGAELYRTTAPSDAERAARSAAGQFDVAVAAGGDGTVHEVANGLALSTTALAVVPLGSMNILAREIGVPFGADRAAEWIARAEPRPLTLGRRGERWFVLMAGLGYDAYALDVALGRAARAGRKVSLFDYIRAAWTAARTYSFPTIEIEADGWKARAAFGFVANCPRYGANLRIAREARLEEPVLDVVLVDSGGVADIARALAVILAGRQRRTRGFLYRKATEVAARSSGGAPVPSQIDGERGSPLPAIFRAAPEALLLLRTPDVR